MSNINTTESIKKDSKGQLFYKGFLRYSGAFILGYISYLIFLDIPPLFYLVEDGDKILTGSILGGSSILYFFFINNIIWKISNEYRMFAMPEIFIGATAGESFSQKVFWHIGPQTFSYVFVVFLIVWVSFFIGGYSLSS